jgi:hypothetical protein
MNTNATENNTRGPGRPPKAIKFPDKSFTMKEVISLNSGNLCGLAVRQKVNAGIASGKLVKLAKKLEKAGPGAPEFRFIRNSKLSKAQRQALLTTPVPVTEATPQTEAVTA